MLTRKNRGRYGDGYLLARECDRCGGPKRDLCLAETHVSDNQSIHRLTGCKVVQHFLDGAALIRCLPERETRDEALIRVLGRYQLRCKRAAALEGLRVHGSRRPVE